MKRNRNIDIIRAIAILLVVLYHIFAITGINFNNDILSLFIEYGGIVGVSTFFILSGFGIYKSLKSSEEKNEKFSYRKYMKKRFFRIAPQYYFSLLVMLFFTSNAIYISKDQILTLISHIFFFHNFFYTIAGAISGVCWTLAVTFQFYLIAPYIYKLFKKYPKITLILSYIICFVLKFIIFHYIIAPGTEYNVFLYSNYGNQIFTALQFFVSGMFIAYMLDKKYGINSIINYFMVVFFTVALYYVLKLGQCTNLSFIKNTGIYSDCEMGYIWHFILSIILSFLFYFIGNIKLKLNSLIAKVLIFISKYEYGIYLWHLIIITNLHNYSPLFKNLESSNHIILYVSLVLISILVGYLMTRIVDSFNYETLFNKDILKQIIKILFIFFIAWICYKSYFTLKVMYKNAKIYFTSQVVDNNESKKIADNVINKINIDNNCKYIYIDNEQTGYLYFFQLRYYLSPCQGIHFNEYVYTINHGSIDDIYNYLDEKDIKYIIIRDNPTLSKYLNTEFDSKKGSIYIKSKKYHDIESMMEKIE
jgi:predicted acyltransferases